MAGFFQCINFMKKHLFFLLLSPGLLVTSLAAASGGLCGDILTDRTEVSHLLDVYRSKKLSFNATSSRKLVFTGVEGKDVYNPTKPFVIKFKNEMQEVMAARVESRDSEISQVMFFTRGKGVWNLLVDAPVFRMQDPFFTRINNEVVLGGVEIFERPEGGYGYKTIFMRGPSLEKMSPFAAGPVGMKDIRLVELPNGEIGLFSRPQGMIPGTEINAGPGKIGYTKIKNLSELNAETIIRAPLIESQFAGVEWGGVNEAQMLSDGRVAVLAHIAKFDANRNRHYYSVVFTLNPTTGKASPFEMILERSDLQLGLNGQSKRSDLKDVVFSGGLVIGEKSATIVVGAGDAEVHTKVIDRPLSFN